MAEDRRGGPATLEARGREDLTGFIHRVAIGSSMPTNSGTIAPVLGSTNIPRILARTCPKGVVGGCVRTADGTRSVGLRLGGSEIAEFPRLFTSLDLECAFRS
jgi:hypothetical protein